MTISLELISAKPTLLNRFYAISAGGLLPFAFSPYDLYWLAIVCLATLSYFLYTAVSSRESFLLGYLFGFAMFGIGVNWLHISINLFGGVNLAGALFFTYLLVAFLALYPALVGYFTSYFTGNYRLLLFAPIWTLTEWCRGWLFTGFPWLNIGTSQTESLFSSFAPVFGDYGISFIMSSTAVAFVFLLQRKMMTTVLSISFIIIICTSAILLSPISWSNSMGRMINVTLIQGAISQEVKWEPETRAKTYTVYTELSDPYWTSTDLIIWPETAIPSPYHTADDFIGYVEENIANTNALFMSGLIYKEPNTDQYYNSILLVDDEHQFYHKHHLVPFGEYLPLRSILGIVLNVMGISIFDFMQGDQQKKLLATSKGIFGMSICYEDAYASEIRQALPAANILVNVSNDAWFGDSAAPHQHLQIARMRALESQRYLLRATNNGVSAVIDHKGKIVAKSPQFEPHALSAEVELLHGSTPFSRYGNSFLLVLCLLMIGGAVWRQKLRCS